MPRNRCFYIISQMNGLAMDLEGGSDEPGTKVIMWDKKDDDADNQLFYEHSITGTIRSYQNDMCLTTEGDDLEMQPFEPRNDAQQWKISKNTIKSRVKTKYVLDIKRKNDDPGANIVAYKYKGSDNQHWDFDFVNGPKPRDKRRNFFIKSRLSNLVLDLEGGSDDPGTRVIQWHQKDVSDADNQLWFKHVSTGTVRSKMNESMCLDVNDDGEFCINEYESGKRDQKWKRTGNRLINRKSLDRVLDLADCDTEPGAKIVAWDYNGGDNQQWKFVFDDSDAYSESSDSD